MLKANSSTTTTSMPNNADLVDLALSGKYPGLLASLLAPKLADDIYYQIESGSEGTRRTT